MFENFRKVVHGTSPIGNIDGTWGLRDNGLWFLLNTCTAPAVHLPIKPGDIKEPRLWGTLGRTGMEFFGEEMVKLAQRKGGWVTFTAEELKADRYDLDFWVECGWLTKAENEKGYDFTIGFVMLVVSRSGQH